MPCLQADISDEFLKSFIPETVYLVEGDIALPAPKIAEPATAPAPKPAEEDATSPATVAAPEAMVPPEPVAAKQHVHELPKIPKKEPAAQKQKYKVAGENRKGVVVLVTIPEAEFAHLPQLQFLQKILSAIGLQPSDVAYVNNISGELALFEELQKELQVNYIISFASRIETALPHEKFTLYNPVTVGSVPVVFSQALKMLADNVEHKKMLWGALQRTFKV
ncbi:hypothetical protein [Pontibacter mangrovi]|uniref:Uncharacterized protein n=1 Tax=Pontibacter mangrovi TaxID=2589816 RepID=A0A501W8Y7_9BACT|nr:hypothetical protein [Pontibacter mangrovi]TPE45818.1 hypothetical protein FJM65_00270 [Pontibacter mangrovi]